MKQQDVQVGKYYYETMAGTVVFVFEKVGDTFVAYERHILEDGGAVVRNGTIQARFLIPLYAWREPPISLTE